jgi:hypothetical protein
MTRLFGSLVFAIALFSVSPSFAGNGNGKDNGHGRDHAPGQVRTQVPELSGGGAAAGLGLIAGATAIALGRRRTRRA